MNTVGAMAGLSTAGLPEFKPGMTALSAEQLNRHVALTRELASRLSRREPTLAPGPRSAGVGIKTVKIVTVSALVYSCKDIDADGAAVGDAFDVYPRVFSGGVYLNGAGYDLTATTGTVVMEKFTAGAYLDILAVQKRLHRATGEAPLRWHTWDLFHLSSCVA